MLIQLNRRQSITGYEVRDRSATLAVGQMISNYRAHTSEALFRFWNGRSSLRSS